MAKGSRGGRTVDMIGPIRSPLALDSQIIGSKKTPGIGANTTIPGTAPRSAPIRSPLAPSVMRRGK